MTIPSLNAEKQAGFLIGGRSPVSWLRAFSRYGEKQDLLKRPSAWLKPESDFPSLRSGPLFGHCLSVLCEREARQTSEGSLQKSKAAASFLPKRLKAQDWRFFQNERNSNKLSISKTRFEKGKKRPQNPSEASISRHSAALPIVLEHQASRNLLESATGNALLLKAKQKDRQRTIRTPLKANSPSSPAPPGGPKIHRRWRVKLEDRTRASMKARGFAGLQTHGKWMPQTEDEEVQIRERSHFSKRSEDEKQPSGRIERLSKKEKKSASQTLSRPQASSLSAQWSIPVNGLPASGALLERSVRAGSADKSPDAPSRVSKSEPISRRQALKPRQDAALVRPETTFPVRTSPSRDPEGRLGKDLHGSAPDSDPAPMTKNRLSPEEVAMPLLASPLPPLHVPPEAVAPSPPLGAAIMKQGLESGTRPMNPVEEEEDLRRLSVSIKRILDEEARRHGIDV